MVWKEGNEGAETQGTGGGTEWEKGKYRGNMLLASERRQRISQSVALTSMDTSCPCASRDGPGPNSVVSLEVGHLHQYSRLTTGESQNARLISPFIAR